ncbi:MAG: hypothetical protein Q9183_003417, partial [Haloplaca sp. 2 TL-2023]
PHAINISSKRLREKYRELYRHIDHTIGQNLRHGINGILTKAKPLFIDRFVCTSLGSFAVEVEKCGTNTDINRPLHQLVAFVMMKEVIDSHLGTRNCPVYFQDPAMSAADKELLWSLRYTVIEDPEALGLVGATTFLYTPCAVWNHVQDLLSEAKAYPALYVGNDIRFYWRRIQFEKDHPGVEDYLHLSVAEAESLWKNVFEPFIAKKGLSEDLPPIWYPSKKTDTFTAHWASH